MCLSAIHKRYPTQLTYNYDKDSYDVGEGFGHFGLAVNDVYGLVNKIKSNSALLCSATALHDDATHTAADGSITRDAGPVKGMRHAQQQQL